MGCGLPEPKFIVAVRPAANLANMAARHYNQHYHTKFGGQSSGLSAGTFGADSRAASFGSRGRVGWWLANTGSRQINLFGSREVEAGKLPTVKLN